MFENRDEVRLGLGGVGGVGVVGVEGGVEGLDVSDEGMVIVGGHELGFHTLGLFTPCSVCYFTHTN